MPGYGLPSVPAKPRPPRPPRPSRIPRARPPDRCFACGWDPAPRRLYCSDDCSQRSRAKQIAPKLEMTEEEALELIRANDKEGQ